MQVLQACKNFSYSLAAIFERVDAWHYSGNAKMILMGAMIVEVCQHLGVNGTNCQFDLEDKLQYWYSEITTPKDIIVSFSCLSCVSVL